MFLPIPQRHPTLRIAMLYCSVGLTRCCSSYTFTDSAWDSMQEDAVEALEDATTPKKVRGRAYSELEMYSQPRMRAIWYFICCAAWLFQRGTGVRKPVYTDPPASQDSRKTSSMKLSEIISQDDLRQSQARENLNKAVNPDAVVYLNLCAPKPHQSKCLLFFAAMVRKWTMRTLFTPSDGFCSVLHLVTHMLGSGLTEEFS